MSSENRTSVPNSLNEHWMPFTSNKGFKANPRLITEAKGVYLKTHHGKTQIDGSSGLFCNPLGHGRREITEAVTKQLEKLDYVQPFQQGFGGSFELATRISKHTPGDLNKIFYTNCGSTAVETAIKIAIAYHRAKGDGKRFRFIGRERAYHGMNIGATSVGGMIHNVKTFASVLMPGVLHMRHTHLPEHKFVSGQPETGAELANDLERICENFGGENIAACIVEPVAGSTGCLVPPKGYLQKLREICDKHGILLIFDEVICGWGRMGSVFASQEFGVVPDMMVLSKATTNGVVPMGVVACKEEMYDAVMDAAPMGTVELFHGYTYSGHPTCMAAGIANLELMKETNILHQVQSHTAPYLASKWKALEEHPLVGEARCLGMFASLEIVEDKNNYKRFENSKEVVTRCKDYCYDNGLVMRPIVNKMVIAPPLICSNDHIDEIIEKVWKCLDLTAQSIK